MARVQHIVRRIELLGASVDVVTSEDVLAFIADAASANRKVVVANQNLHSLYISRRDPGMAAFFDLADLIEIDSVPIVLWGKLMGLQTTRANRCTYLDWRDAFWAQAAANRWRVYCLGSEAGVAAEAARRLMAEWPGVEVVAHHGFFDQTAGSSENAAVVAQINAFEPHVVLVGMGMPIQENWISRNFHELTHGAILSVGAAFDYEAGVQGAAPRILGALCLEWLYRLACNPRRMFGRYLIEPWSLLDAARADLRRYLAPASNGRPSWTPNHIRRAPSGESDPGSFLAA